MRGVLAPREHDIACQRVQNNWRALPFNSPYHAVLAVKGCARYACLRPAAV
jgi:hypothetical protein